MEKNVSYKNTVEITGNISSIGEIKQKSNGKEFMYINIAQNSKDRITTVGKLESYQKDSKQTLQIRPFEVQKVEIQHTKETTQTVSKETTNEIDM